MALTADDLRRQARTSRLSAMMGGNRERRQAPMRQPKPPDAPPPLETMAPSKAQETGALAGAIAGAASTLAGFIRPELGVMIGMVGNAARQSAVSGVMADEAQAAEAMAERNKLRLGEARRQEVDYKRRLNQAQRGAQGRPGQAQGMPMQPMQGTQVAMGAADKSKALLTGGM